MKKLPAKMKENCQQVHACLTQCGGTKNTFLIIMSVCTLQHLFSDTNPIEANKCSQVLTTNAQLVQDEEAA